MDIDWEPTTAANRTDAIKYAHFLFKFTQALHAVGKKLSVLTIFNTKAIYSYFHSLTLRRGTKFGTLVLSHKRMLTSHI
jgi:hypothetical protein